MTKQYKKPEDMIDYNAELDTINGLMSIFFAYNQQPPGKLLYRKS